MLPSAIFRVLSRCLPVLSAISLYGGCTPPLSAVPTLLSQGRLYDAACAVDAARTKARPGRAKAGRADRALQEQEREVARALMEHLRERILLKTVSVAELRHRLGAAGDQIARQTVIVRLQRQALERSLRLTNDDPKLDFNSGPDPALSWRRLSMAPEELAALTGEKGRSALVIPETGSGAEASAETGAAEVSHTSTHVLTLGLLPKYERSAKSSPDRHFSSPVTEEKARLEAPAAAKLYYDILHGPERSSADKVPILHRRAEAPPGHLAYEDTILFQRHPREREAPLTLSIRADYRYHEGSRSCSINVPLEIPLPAGELLENRIEEVFHGAYRSPADFLTPAAVEGKQPAGEPSASPSNKSPN